MIEKKTFEIHFDHFLTVLKFNYSPKEHNKPRFFLQLRPFSHILVDLLSQRTRIKAILYSSPQRTIALSTFKSSLFILNSDKERTNVLIFRWMSASARSTQTRRYCWSTSPTKTTSIIPLSFPLA